MYRLFFQIEMRLSLIVCFALCPLISCSEIRRIYSKLYLFGGRRFALKSNFNFDSEVTWQYRKVTGQIHWPSDFVRIWYVRLVEIMPMPHIAHMWKCRFVLFLFFELHRPRVTGPMENMHQNEIMSMYTLCLVLLFLIPRSIWRKKKHTQFLQTEYFKLVTSPSGLHKVHKYFVKQIICKEELFRAYHSIFPCRTLTF